MKSSRKRDIERKGEKRREKEAVELPFDRRTGLTTRGKSRSVGVVSIVWKIDSLRFFIYLLSLVLELLRKLQLLRNGCSTILSFY